MTFPNFDVARRAAELFARAYYERSREGYQRDLALYVVKWSDLPHEHQLVLIRAAVDALPEYEKFRSEHATEGL